VVHIVAVLVEACGVLRFLSGRVRMWETSVVPYVGALLVWSVVALILSSIAGWRGLGDVHYFHMWMWLE
jgi:hypothetical protein